MTPYYRVTLKFLTSFMAGMISISAFQYARDAIDQSPKTVTFKTQAATVLPEVAHRGLTTKAVENTPAAMTAAIKAKYAGVEFDVRLTRDRRGVVMHDTTMDRTTDCLGPVTNLTLKAAEACGATSLEDMAHHIQKAGLQYKWSGRVFVHVKTSQSDGTAGGLINRMSVLKDATKRVVFLLEDERNAPRLTKAGWSGDLGLMLHTAYDWSLTKDFDVMVPYASSLDKPGYDVEFTPARLEMLRKEKVELVCLPGFPYSRNELYNFTKGDLGCSVLMV